MILVTMINMVTKETLIMRFEDMIDKDSGNRQTLLWQFKKLWQMKY